MKTLGSLLITVTLLTIAISAQKAPRGDSPATSVLQDSLEGSVTRVGNDALGPYLNGVYSVVSIVQGIGNWELDAKASSMRRVRVDLGDPVIGTNPNPPFQAAFVPVRFISKCTTSIFTLAVDQSTPCPLALSIDHNGTTYALRAEPTNYPGTQTVTWTCHARNSTKCVSWSMVPSVVQADGQRKIIMQLVKPAVKRTPEQLLGRFYISFDVEVTTP